MRVGLVSNEIRHPFLNSIVSWNRLYDEYAKKFEDLNKQQLHTQSQCGTLVSELQPKLDHLAGKMKGSNSHQKQLDEKSSKLTSLFNECKRTAK